MVGCGPSWGMAMVTVKELLDGHAALDIKCLDRIYLNGYVPNLQVPGQVVSFMSGHLGLPIASPAIIEQIGTRFRRAVAVFAKANGVALVMFKKGDRKRDVMDPYLRRQAATGVPGVAAIGVAQEYQNVFAATERTDGGRLWFSFYKADRRVTCSLPAASKQIWTGLIGMSGDPSSASASLSRSVAVRQLAQPSRYIGLERP